MTDLATVEVGDELPSIERTHDLQTSVVYAAASGDYNPLHYDPEFAAQVSPTGDIIAHGMFSMGLASRLLTEWAGGPERVAAVEVRFRKPWPIGTTSTFTGTVAEVAQDTITVQLVGTNENGDTILTGTGRVRRD